MTGLVLQADARALPMPDATVDLIVTSPPYYALRSYQDSGEHYTGQLGSEVTPAEYVTALIDCTREMMRVLKPTGSIWVNLGDKYANSQGVQGSSGERSDRAQASTYEPRTAVVGFRSKTLLGIPWRYAVRCVDELGLILRAEVIWSKPNGLPESVTDRVRRSHEQWFHFTKQPRYYSAVDEIRDKHRSDARKWDSGVSATNKGKSRSVWQGGDESRFSGGQNPLGKLPGSVWEIATQPLTVPAHLGVDHFAAFPVEWPRRIILGWSPASICTACGEGRRLVVDRSEKTLHRPSGADQVGCRMHEVAPRVRSSAGNVHTRHRIVGHACACPEPVTETRPGVVLDPFGGTGTTALAAKALGRHGISVDMSADYCRIARWRTNDPGELAKALKVDKPPAVAAGQMDLFELIGGTP